MPGQREVSGAGMVEPRPEKSKEVGIVGGFGGGATQTRVSQAGRRRASVWVVTTSLSGGHGFPARLHQGWLSSWLGYCHTCTHRPLGAQAPPCWLLVTTARLPDPESRKPPSGAASHGRTRQRQPHQPSLLSFYLPIHHQASTGDPTPIQSRHSFLGSPGAPHHLNMLGPSSWLF